MLIALLIVAATPVVCFGDITDRLQEAEGHSIQLSEGDCALRKTIRYCKPTVVHGEGIALTRLHVVTGTTAFEFARGPRCPKKSPGAGRSLIEGLSIQSPGVVTSTIPTFGIKVLARMNIEHVETVGFVQGIRIDGHAVSQGTNANAWRMTSIHVKNAQHAGVYIDGPDVNVGLTLGAEVYANCSRANRWEATLGPCAGYFDSSFLGSVHVAVLGDLQIDRDTGKAHPAHWFEGDSQFSECYGCYNEGSIPSKISQNTMVIGGLINIDGEGLRFGGTVMSGLEVKNHRDPANPVSVRLGTRTSLGTGLEVRTDARTGNNILRFKYEPSRKAWRLDINNLNALIVFRIYLDAVLQIYNPKLPPF
jgi:hypothetical protein